MADETWMPHAGHFIGGAECHFHLNTEVNGFIVSTVGEYHPMMSLSPRTIGYDRLYETMVFQSKPSDNLCCPFIMRTPRELDFAGYNDPGEARLGHLAMVKKWSQAGPEGHGQADEEPGDD